MSKRLLEELEHADWGAVYVDGRLVAAFCTPPLALAFARALLRGDSAISVAVVARREHTDPPAN